MYYQLIYHIPNAVEQDSTDDNDYKAHHFNRHLAFNLTSGGLRKFGQDINFAVVRDDFRGFEIIISYPDFLTPGYPVLFSIVQEQEAMFDIKFYDKPVCFDHVYLHQISTLEFLNRLSGSKGQLMNTLELINEPYLEHYEDMEKKTKAALEKLNKQNESNDSEKENNVL